MEFWTGWDPGIRLAALWKLLRREEWFKKESWKERGCQCQPDTTDGQTFVFKCKTLERWVEKSRTRYANKWLVSHKKKMKRQGFF